MTNANRLTLLAAAGSLAVLLGCINDSATPPSRQTLATKLHYTSPDNVPSGAYHLELESGQDTAALRLKVVGPADQKGYGLACFLLADSSRVAWANTGGALQTYAKEGAVFALDSDPLFKTVLRNPSELDVGIFQKGGNAPVFSGAEALFTVALSLRSQASIGSVSLASSTDPKRRFTILDEDRQVVTGQTLYIGTLEAR